MPAAWVGAAAAIGGALLSSNSADNATDAQKEASANSIAEQKREYDLNLANQQPYLDAGKAALSQYQTEINTPTTAADVMANDPGYQFGLDQGQTALDRKIAAMGGRVSGAALKASDRYATDYATTGYNSAYQRSQDRLNRLASLAGLGQTATTASAASGSASTNAITALQAAQANATATGGVAQANIWGNAGNQLAAMYKTRQTPTSNYQTPTQFQDGTNFYGGSGENLYGDGYGPG
jgi:hypothetical protein